MAACGVCHRDPQRMNSDWAECSHVDCPHRKAQQPYTPSGRRAPVADSDNQPIYGCTSCGSYYHTRSHCP